MKKRNKLDFLVVLEEVEGELDVFHAVDALARHLHELQSMLKRRG